MQGVTQIVSCVFSLFNGTAIPCLRPILRGRFRDGAVRAYNDFAHVHQSVNHKEENVVKKMFWVCLLVFGLILCWTLVYAGDFYVIPVQKCCTCKGTLDGTRWCDNGDGTVTDLTTCLLWLKDASWGETYAFWVNTETGINAHDRAALLMNTVGGLTDGSQIGDWRLPTKAELYGLVIEPEGVRYDDMKAFTGVQSAYYWSSTNNKYDTSLAYAVHLGAGFVAIDSKASTSNVWPVRNAQ